MGSAVKGCAASQAGPVHAALRSCNESTDCEIDSLKSELNIGLGTAGVERDAHLPRFPRGEKEAVTMNIRRATPADRDELVDIWLRSVRATHTFLSEVDIQSLLPDVRDYLTSDEPELWVLCSDSAEVMGFMGMSESYMESLFLAPEYLRSGGGRLLVRHALDKHPELTTDVNEQNPEALRFYEACGFVVVGRSELDDAGRPFPLLHLRLAAPYE
jgi:putative acetyltransferase